MTTVAADLPTLTASSTATSSPSGATVGGVTTLLRLEGAVALLASLLAYEALGTSWWLFAALFLAPDLSMLGYLANRKLGAAIYNAGHSYLAPATLAVLGWVLGGDASLLAPVLIWVAHIGFDRALSYGLKYGRAFGATHLG